MALFKRAFTSYTIIAAALPIVRRVGREVSLRTGWGQESALVRKALKLPEPPRHRRRLLRRGR